LKFPAKGGLGDVFDSTNLALLKSASREWFKPVKQNQN